MANHYHNAPGIQGNSTRARKQLFGVQHKACQCPLDIDGHANRLTASREI